MFKNNLTLGYVLLVGVPLLILVATLRAGSGLAAPASVAGEWTVEQTGTSPADHCSGPLANLANVRQPAVSFYQTGTDLLITFNDPPKTTFSGTVRDRRIAGIARYANGAAGCGGNAAIHFEAAIAGKPERRSLQGQLWLEGCESCAPVQFRASKSASPGK